jgi:hypothetical protein
MNAVVRASMDTEVSTTARKYRRGEIEVSLDNDAAHPEKETALRESDAQLLL